MEILDCAIDTKCSANARQLPGCIKCDGLDVECFGKLPPTDQGQALLACLTAKCNV